MGSTDASYRIIIQVHRIVRYDLKDGIWPPYHCCDSLPYTVLAWFRLGLTLSSPIYGDQLHLHVVFVCDCLHGDNSTLWRFRR